MEAFASFFRNLSKKHQSKYYPLIPDVLNVLPPVKESHESENLSKALLALIDLAETAPKMFKPLFRNLVVFSISVIQDKELDNMCRQNALELMATFADYAPSMCRKDVSYTNDMITQCLSLMTDLGEDDDDAAEWLTSDDVSVEPCTISENSSSSNDLVAAGSRRERFEPRRRRAVHGPAGE
jgi:importin-5